MSKVTSKENYKKAISLRKSGYTYKKISETLGIPVRTIRDYIDRDNGVYHQKKIKSVIKDLSNNITEEKIEEIEKSIFEERQEVVVTKTSVLKEEDRRGKKYYVFTGCLNDTKVDETFFKSLLNYCDFRNARLLIQPLKYTNVTSHLASEISKNPSWDPKIDPYKIDERFEIMDKLTILANVNVISTAAKPLSSFNQVSKGDSIFFAHPRLEFVHIPVIGNEPPACVGCSGVINAPDYSESKAGYIADNFHSMSAFVFEVDFDNDMFVRTELIFDGKGFADRGIYYTPTGVEKKTIETLVCGDIHVGSECDKVMDCTFFGPRSIVNVLKPKNVVLHDILDFHSRSHHHKHDGLLNWIKSQNGSDNVKNELDKVADFISKIDKAVPYAKIHIVDSNHDSHCYKWMNTSEAANDYVNKLIYHKLWLLVLENESSNPLKLYLTKEKGLCVNFINSSNSFKILDNELSLHGDKGSNGSRGSLNQYSTYHSVNISGHSHTLAKTGNAWKAGTSTKLKLGYNNEGASNWVNGHIITNFNGLNQSITIIKGRWCI